uniref:glycosyltransferase family 4 protein n=1 Tax=Trichocoleus desertorum TaxID=1481672 RepID=UPI0025B5CC1F|nr:glycosyltransferase family 4 protein [Trichocoleus desertorum]
MQHLLFITERFPPDLGGVATSAGRITATLCQLGVDVDVVTWSRYLPPGEVLPPEAIATSAGKLCVHRIGLYRAWDMTMPHTLNVLDWLHQTHAYDAVWGHYVFPSGFLATWWAEGQQLPSVVSARGNDIDRILFPPGDFARLQWTLERASLVTAVSQDLSQKIQRLCRRDDTLLLPNVVDTQQFRPTGLDKGLDKEAIAALKATLGIAPEEIVLGFSGELREKKGQQFLLDALTTVRTQRPTCLLIIGEVRPTEQAVLQTYAMQHPENAQRVIVTGHLPSPEAVAQHLQLCDLYLQPSLWEGMPNALLEAMACELCCIASDAGGNAEVIEHGKNGFLLPRFQLHQLGAIALELLDQEPTARKTIGQAARDRILSHYSLAQEKTKLQAICDRLQQFLPP